MIGDWTSCLSVRCRSAIRSYHPLLQVSGDFVWRARSIASIFNELYCFSILKSYQVTNLEVTMYFPLGSDCGTGGRAVVSEPEGSGFKTVIAKVH